MIKSDFCNDLEYIDTINSITSNIKKSPYSLYTIGYEKKSIEMFINQLIENNIKLVVDVRQNAFSMKFDFIKSTLEKVLEKLDIDYLHTVYYIK